MTLARRPATGRSCPRVFRRSLLAAGLFLGAPEALGPRVAVDLEVSIPPGSPLEWGGMFPAITPRRGPILPPITPRDGPGTRPDPNRTSPTRLRATPELQTVSSFGLVRILTWDIAAHLPWVTGRAENVPKGAITGLPPEMPPAPTVSNGTYWVCVAPFLRLLLHPAQVSEPEIIAHVIELGDPVLYVLDAVQSQRGLSTACQRVRAAIAAPRRPVRPRTGSTPAETMLHGFVFRELLSTHAYDPEAGFGARLFLLGEDLAPLVAEYVNADDPLLRRNAVAALSRYHTPQVASTLMMVAAETTDPVVLIRALAALARARVALPPRPLVDRLQRSKNEYETVALIHALGHMGAAEAVPVLLGMARNTNDPDVLRAIMSAMLGLPLAGNTMHEAVAFAQSLLNRCVTNPTSFRVAQDRNVAADRPDDPNLRAEILAQLSVLLLKRLDASRPAWGERLLKLFPPIAGRPVRRVPDDAPMPFNPGMGHANRAMGTVALPIAFQVLDVLPSLAPDGATVLQEIVDDATTEPSLRGFALALLPPDSRGRIASSLALDEREATEVRHAALQVLADDGNERLEDIGRLLMVQLAGFRFGINDPEREQLFLAAVQLLDDRKKIAVRDLLPLLSLIEGAKPLGEDPIQAIRDLVEALVRAANEGQVGIALRKRIDEILDRVQALGTNKHLSPRTRPQLRSYVEAQLANARARPYDKNWHRALKEAITNYLLGFPDQGLLNEANFKPQVPLEEAILLALGRTRDPEAVKALIKLLRESRNPNRAMLCLALAAAGDRSAARHLLPVLVDKEPFARLCAWRGLVHLTGQDFTADWYLGRPEAWADAADRYAAWIAANAGTR